MQSDNSVVITGRVVKGPFVSYVNQDKSKIRLKYQVQVEARKKDNGQSFSPWVRSLGNQAQKDYENIKVGDIVTVGGKIVTRAELKKHYLRVQTDPETGAKACVEIDSDDPDIDTYDDVVPFVERRMVAEIQADDVRYFSKTLSMMSPDALEKFIASRGLTKVAEEKMAQQKIDNEVADHRARAEAKAAEVAKDPKAFNNTDEDEGAD